MYPREFNAVLTKFKLDKNSKEIYVEGSTDKNFYQLHLNACKEDNEAQFIDISTIDFSSETEKILAKGYDEKSNRDKVIYLMDCLKERGYTLARGIVDKDVLPHTRGLPKNDLVICTDNSGIEMYFFSRKNIKKVQSLCFNKISTEIVESFMKQLITISAIRVMEKRENISLSKPNEEKDFLNYCIEEKKKNKKGETIKMYRFDENRYIDALLTNKNPQFASKKQVIKDKIDEYKRELTRDDIRDNINGHELVWLLTYCIKKCENKKYNQSPSGAICGIYMNAVESLLMKETNLMKSLLNF